MLQMGSIVSSGKFFRFFAVVLCLGCCSGADVGSGGEKAQVSSSPFTSLFDGLDIMFLAEMAVVIVALSTCFKVKSESKKPKTMSVVEHLDSDSKPVRATGARRRTQAALVEVVRSGRAVQLPQILRSACLTETDIDDDLSPEERCCELVHASMLGCVAHRQFAEAVAAFDAVEDFVGRGTGKLWGVMLYAAAKAEHGDRGILFFQRLQVFQEPNTNDYMNVVRCHTLGSDTSRFRNFLCDLKASGVQWDATTREKALGACLTSDCFAFTEILVDYAPCVQEMDVRAFASQMKFSLLRGKPARCFDLKELMKARGIIPNAFTYSLLLEAACRSEDVDSARRVMKSLDLHDNSFGIINCTSLIGSLVDAGMVKEAEQTLLLLERRGAAPFASCYELVANGFRDAGLIRESRALLEHRRMSQTQGARHQRQRCSISSCGA